MKKLLFIILLLFSQNSFAKTSEWETKTRERCKNWTTLEKVPQEEAIRCLKAIITRINEQTETNKVNIEQIYTAFGQ